MYNDKIFFMDNKNKDDNDMLRYVYQFMNKQDMDVVYFVPLTFKQELYMYKYFSIGLLLSCFRLLIILILLDITAH